MLCETMEFKVHVVMMGGDGMSVMIWRQCLHHFQKNEIGLLRKEDGWDDDVDEGFIIGAEGMDGGKQQLSDNEEGIIDKFQIIIFIIIMQAS